jgi:integrase
MAQHGSLTKRAIDAMKPGETIWDAEGRETVKGLGVRCRDGGSRSFCLKYRISGRQRWLTIGTVGSPWTVESARNQAKKLLGEVAQGKDPAEALLEAKRAGSVEDLCEIYREASATMLTRRGMPKSSRTLEVEAGHIDRHIVPLLGKKRANSLTSLDIERFQQQVADGDTAAVVDTPKRGGKAIVTGGRGAAARCMNTLSTIFSFGCKRHLVDANPCLGVIRYKGEGVQRFLTPAEMAKLGTALADVQPLVPQAVAVIKLLALTGARKSEITRLRWSWVDLDYGVLRIPRDMTKGGHSRLIVLGTPAVDILKSLPRFLPDDDEPAFGGIPGRNATGLEDNVFPPLAPGERYHGPSKSWASIRELAGVICRLHDLRHNFASVGHELGYTLPTIAALLGHGLRGSTGRYIHHADPALREAAERISQEVLARLEGRSATVIAFDAKARQAGSL